MPPRNQLVFERPIYELEDRLADLEQKDDPSPETRAEIRDLRLEITQKRREIFANLDAWQITQVARHPERPQTLDYLELIFDEFVELHGDRAFRDDPSILTGFVTLDSLKVLFVGGAHEVSHSSLGFLRVSEGENQGHLNSPSNLSVSLNFITV